MARGTREQGVAEGKGARRAQAGTPLSWSVTQQTRGWASGPSLLLVHQYVPLHPAIPSASLNAVDYKRV